MAILVSTSSNVTKSLKVLVPIDSLMILPTLFKDKSVKNPL